MTADVELLPLPESDCQPNARRWLFPVDMRRQVQDYARANVAHATAARDAENEALRAEVERLQSAFEQAVEADKDEEVQRLHAEKVAHFIARTDAEAEVKALRSEMERLKRELSARGDYVNEQAIARADRLAEALRRKVKIWESEGIRLNGGATKPYTDDENSIRAFVLGCCADELRALLRDQIEGFDNG